MNSKADDAFSLKLQALIDGELPPREASRLASQLESDPEARALAENLRNLAALVRSAPPERAVPEPRDFYWSRIRQGIERMEPRPEPSAGSGPLRWLAWLVPVGAAVVAAMLLLSPEPTPSPQAAPAVALTDHVVETPSEDLSSLTFYASQESMTVVWLGRIDFL